MTRPLHAPETAAAKWIGPRPGLIGGQADAGDNLVVCTQSLDRLGVNVVGDADFDLDRFQFGRIGFVEDINRAHRLMFHVWPLCTAGAMFMLSPTAPISRLQA